MIPETAELGFGADVGVSDGTGPYLLPLTDVDARIVETALAMGATIQPGWDVPYVEDPRRFIGDFCGYRQLRRAYTLDAPVAEALARLADSHRVVSDWPVFRGIRMPAGGYASSDTTPVVTSDEGRGPRTLRLPTLGAGETRHAGGIDWGYGGDGPAELARAILVALYPQSGVVRTPACYQLFKRQIIARLPHAEFTMTASEVKAWFTGWLKLSQRQPG